MCTPARNRQLILFLAIAAVGLGLVAQDASAQTLQYPPYGAWRGRAVARDGLFRVQRYRWGGGITPAGASVLNTLIPVIPDIVGAIGGGRSAVGDDRDRSTATPRWAGWDEYRVEQKRATDLLLRLEELSGPQPAAPSAPPPPEYRGPHSPPWAGSAMMHPGSTDKITGCPSYTL